MSVRLITIRDPQACFSRSVRVAFAAKALLSANSCWRRSRQDELDPRSLAGSAVQIEPTAQAIRDDVMDDMKTEASAPLIAACREERIEGFTPDIKAHAAAVVGKKNFDIVLSGGQHLYTDGTSLAVGKRMRDSRA